MSVRYPKTDRRLLGTWKSDKERTVRDWVYPKRLATQKRKRIEDIFGKLTLRFTRSRIHVTYDEDSWTHDYRILAADNYSVVIEVDYAEDAELEHWRFDSDGCMYKSVSGQNTEYFSKMDRM